MPFEGPKMPQWKDGTEDTDREFTPIDKDYEDLDEEGKSQRLREIG